MSDYKWRRLEESLGVNKKKPTRGVELPVPENGEDKPKSETKPKTNKPRFQQRKAIKADDPYL